MLLVSLMCESLPAVVIFLALFASFCRQFISQCVPLLFLWDAKLMFGFLEFYWVAKKPAGFSLKIKAR